MIGDRETSGLRPAGEVALHIGLGDHPFGVGEQLGDCGGHTAQVAADGAHQSLGGGPVDPAVLAAHFCCDELGKFPGLHRRCVHLGDLGFAQPVEQRFAFGAAFVDEDQGQVVTGVGRQGDQVVRHVGGQFRQLLDHDHGGLREQRPGRQFGQAAAIQSAGRHPADGRVRMSLGRLAHQLLDGTLGEEAFRTVNQRHGRERRGHGLSMPSATDINRSGPLTAGW